MVAIRADSSASFRVVKASSSADDLSIVQQNGTLRAAYTQDGIYTVINQVAYTPAQHRFWRLRDLDSVAFWETSGDGLQWQTLAREPTPFDVERVCIELSAQTTSSISAAETLTIDLLGQNGSGALSICHAPGWVDDFEDEATGANWSTYGGAYLQESGGELLITAPVNRVGYGGYQTSTRFSLLDSAVWVKLAQPLNAATGTEAELIITMDSDNALYLAVQGDQPLVTISYRYQSSSASVLHTLAYDPAQHVYLKIAERDGTIYWYTSADGFIYTQLYALPDPFTGVQRLDDVSAIIQAGTWQNVAAPGQAQFDDFGLPY
jgi:hypothetical protein